MSDNHQVLRKFVVGAICATVSKSAIAPWVRVTYLIQVQDEKVKSGRLKKSYNGCIDCERQLINKEGFLSLWRGNTLSILGFIPTQALNYALARKVKSMFKSGNSIVQFWMSVFSGGFVGCVSLLVVYPLDYIATRLIIDTKDSSDEHDNEYQFDGVLDLCRKTFNSEGLLGFYRGFGVSCVGIFVYRGVYYGMYTTLKSNFFSGETDKATLFKLGFTAAFIAGILSYPFDTIRKRMLTRVGEADEYKGAVDCAKKIARNEGYLSFYKGLGGTVLKGVVSAALTRIVYQKFGSLLKA